MINIENWSEEFDKEFAERQVIGDRKFKEYFEFLYPDIKDFIKSLLSRQEAYIKGLKGEICDLNDEIERLDANAVDRLNEL